MPMVPAMQVLTLYGAIRAIGATTGPVFQGVGKPSILTKLAVIQLVMMIVIIYPLTNKFGIFGTAVAIVLPNLITQIIAGIKVLTIIKCDGYQFIRPLLFPFISISIVILSLYIFISIQRNINITIFIILIFLSGLTYLGMSYLFKKTFDYDIVKMLSKLLR
ncbi:polysaccharide biosynthesis C-terminal domain-containing protein [Acetomicrobium sp.]|uniref:polysaccharide biosynthesis C-terminal domain-containing protein n=1 Tax=Acetomicrobium sp. TaxID=1872099 RepID=UPI002FC6ABFA